MKTQTLLLIISAIIIITLFNLPSGGSKISVINSDGISVNLYDKSGNLIKSQETFSIINSSQTNYRNVPGVYEIDFTISVTNLGQTDLDCLIIDAFPVKFKQSLPTNSLDLIYGKRDKSSWTSSRLSTIPLESLNIQRFQANIKCNFQNKSGSYEIIKSGYIDLLIKPSVYIVFRTSNLDYSKSSTGIAFSSTCGGNLIKYSYGGKKIVSCNQACNCQYQGSNKYLGNLLLSNLPTTGTVYYLYEYNPNDIAVCKDTTTGFNAGKEFTFYYYKQNSTANVSNSLISQNPLMEVNCTL